MSAREIRLRLPKFKFTTPSMDLSFYLELLGMQLPFMRNVADFSGIDGKKDLFIANVFHKAFIAVDEKESEAAAATAVVMGLGGGFKPDPTHLYIFDHPFIFLIRDNKTGSILFMGKINDPAKE
jgi:serine protease inhibitor